MSYQTSLSGLDGSNGGLCVECMLDVDQECWDEIMSGSGTTFCPVVTWTSDAGAVIWSLGLCAYPLVLAGTSIGRKAMSACMVSSVVAPVAGMSGSNLTLTIGTAAPDACPGRAVHLASGRKVNTSGRFQACTWFDGVWSQTFNIDRMGPFNDADYALENLSTLPAGGTLHVGGPFPNLAVYDSPRCGLVTLRGKVDELRVTVASRYEAYIGTAGVGSITIPSAQRSIPWPNT